MSMRLPAMLFICTSLVGCSSAKPDLMSDEWKVVLAPLNAKRNDIPFELKDLHDRAYDLCGDCGEAKQAEGVHLAALELELLEKKFGAQDPRVMQPLRLLSSEGLRNDRGKIRYTVRLAELEDCIFGKNSLDALDDRNRLTDIFASVDSKAGFDYFKSLTPLLPGCIPEKSTLINASCAYLAALAHLKSEGTEYLQEAMKSKTLMCPKTDDSESLRYVRALALARLSLAAYQLNSDAWEPAIKEAIKIMTALKVARWNQQVKMLYLGYLQHAAAVGPEKSLQVSSEVRRWLLSNAKLARRSTVHLLYRKIGEIYRLSGTQQQELASVNEGVELLKDTLLVDDKFAVILLKADVLGHQGKIQEAKTELEHARKLLPQVSDFYLKNFVDDFRQTEGFLNRSKHQ